MQVIDDEPILAWWFSSHDHRLRYKDGRTAALGVTHTVSGPPVVCRHGLHGSSLLLSAVEYAPAPVVWRVELSGDVAFSGNRIAAQRRKYLTAGTNIETILRDFARWCALEVIGLWPAPAAIRERLNCPGARELRLAARAEDRDAVSSPLIGWPGTAAAQSAHYALHSSSSVAAAGAAEHAREALVAQKQGCLSERAVAKVRRQQNERLTAMVTAAIEGGPA